MTLRNIYILIVALCFPMSLHAQSDYYGSGQAYAIEEIAVYGERPMRDIGVQQTNFDSMVDGASKLQKIIYIDLPSIAPTTMVLLILSVGNILSVGFEKTYLMQNDLNMSSSEVISTYVYKMGIISQDYGLGTAVGLFNSLVNFAFLATVNMIAKKTNGYSLW